MPYEVHLDIYDGPFDLLLRLITDQEVDLYEIRLSAIVDGFLAELERLERLDLEVATEFLLIAATLVELKCRRLLPGSDDVELDEELSLFEARDYLLARLVENRTFQLAAATLHSLELDARRRTPRRSGPDERYLGLEPDLLAGVTVEMLKRRAERAFAPKAPPILPTSHVHVDEVSVAETLDGLLGELPSLGVTSFAQLTAKAETTARVVATFLALLELYKRSLVDLGQSETFGELTVTWIGGAGAELGDLGLDDYDQLSESRAPGVRP